MKSRLILYILLIVATTSALCQSNCFENCYSNFEKAKTSTLVPTDRFETNDRILKGLVGCQAPDFSVKTIQGENLRLEELRGKVVVLNFWFIGCAPCVAELPALNKLVDEYKGSDVVFIAFGRDDSQSIQEFLKKHKFKYKIVSGQYDMETKYCLIGGWPTSMVFDKNGILKKVFSGGFIDEKASTHAYEQIKPVINDGLSK